MINRKKVFFLSILSFFFASFFMTRFQDIEGFSSIGWLFIVIFALPSYYSVVSHLGYRKGVFVLIALSIIPVLVEAFAVYTGFPYGGFEYGTRLGGLFFDLVPLSISFAYLPILLGGLFVASKYARGLIEFCLTASVFNLFVDLVIDPAVVHIGFWKYSSGGIYYGVPFSNFIGWLLTGFLYAAFFYLVVDDEKYPLPDGVSVSLIWILCFWTGYLVFNGLYVPALFGGVLVLYLTRSIELF